MIIEYSKTLGHMTYILKGKVELGESGDFIYIEVDDYFEGIDNKYREFLFEQAKLGLSVYDINGKRTKDFDTVVAEWFAIQKPEKIQHQIDEIKRWFTKNDYIMNKIILEEWEKTDIRFVEYKKQRIVNQKELKRLEAIKNGYNI